MLELLSLFGFSAAHYIFFSLQLFFLFNKFHFFLLSCMFKVVIIECLGLLQVPVLSIARVSETTLRPKRPCT